MKKILVALAACVLSVTASAQFVVLQDAKALSKSRTENPAVVAERLAPVSKVSKAKKVQLAANEQILGPYITDEWDDYGVGLPNYDPTRVGTRLPVSKFADFEGGKITKFRFALAYENGPSRVFLVPIDARGNMQPELISQTVPSTVAGWNEVTLNTPVTINNSGIAYYMLGFDYEQRHTTTTYYGQEYYSEECYPLSFVDAGDDYYPQYVYGNLGSGEGWYSLGEAQDNLSVQLIVEGEFADNGLQPLDFGNWVTALNGTVTVDIPVQIKSAAAINNIDYTITTDGVASAEQHLNLTTPLVGLGSNAVIQVPLTADATIGSKTKTITITKVNGVANTAATKSATGTLITAEKTYTRNVVVEEFTGTGCGWCPRGLKGMEDMRNKFGKSFVGIGIHQYNSSDAMYIAPNDYAQLGFTGAPSCKIDRGATTDPWYGEDQYEERILDAFAAELETPAWIGVSVTGEWNDDKTQVTATATGESLIEGANYDVEFVLIADSLTGTGQAWAQANYYAQRYTAAQFEAAGNNLSMFCSGGEYGTSYIVGWKFNDVAIASSYSSGTNRASGFTNMPFAKPVSVSYTLTMPTTAALASAINPDNVAVIALVVDQTTGKIANAAKYYLSGVDPTDGIREVSKQAGDVREVARYSLNGQRLTAPQKGINIVRLSDGTTHKVLVK